MTDKILILDTECTGLSTYAGDRPFMVAMLRETGDSNFLTAKVSHFTRKVFWKIGQIAELKKDIENADTIKVFHNANFDINMLGSIGIKVAGRVFDTLVMAHVWHSGLPSYALKPLCKNLFKIGTDDESELQKAVVRERHLGKKNKWKIADSVKADYWLCMNLCAKYCTTDLARTHELWKKFYAIYSEDENYRAIVDMEMKLSAVANRMSRTGIKLDQSRLAELKKYYSEIFLEEEKKKIKLGYKDLNVNSSLQLKKIFYGEMKLDKKYKRRKNNKSGEERTECIDSKVLLSYASKVPLAKIIVNMKAVEHELGSFINPFIELSAMDGLLHPNYITCEAVTGRMSCSRPNLMNIPNSEADAGMINLRTREIFIPRPDCVLYFPDYSQIEVWIAAYTSKDPVMMGALNNGLDMHGQFCEKFFGDREDYDRCKNKYRKKTKRGTFCIIYGGGPGALMYPLECSFDEARDFRDAFYAQYKTLSEYGKTLAEIGEAVGIIVDPFGRNYPIDRAFSYKALNYMVQGSAAGVMKRALINLDNLFQKKWQGTNLLLAIHDEVCIEVPLKYHSKQIMRDIIGAMQGDFHKYFGMPKPFKVSMAWTSKRWSEKKEIEI